MPCDISFNFQVQSSRAKGIGNRAKKFKVQSVAKVLGFSVKSVWRAIRAMKEVGLLVREGGDKGGKWIVKK